MSVEFLIKCGANGCAGLQVIFSLRAMTAELLPTENDRRISISCEKREGR